MASNTSVITIPLTGGLNVAVSDQMIKPGECTELINYELTTTGRYQRIKGYERFDGQPAPSQVKAADLPGFPFANAGVLMAAIRAERTLRTDAIQPVPGSGPVLGVFRFNGIVYAFRNTEDGTAAKMYRSSGTGWQEVTTPVLSPGGSYEVIETNFSGSAAAREVIGVDGRNPAFRFNGTTFTQITGPITPDQPTHIDVLPSQKLVMSYRGGSFVYSEIGNPAGWSGANGAGEIAVGDEITGIDVQADKATAIFCRNKIFMLYGASEADFQLTAYALNSGAIAGSIQSMGQSIFLDDRGLTKLDRTNQFGDFDAATISQKVQPLLQQRLSSAVSSMIVRGKNQYRLFFSDNTGLILTMFGGEVMGFTELRYNFMANCTWSGEDNTGRELLYAGGTNGYVYQLDSGNAFDNAAYTSSFQTGFMAFGNPEDKKRWRKLVIEADSVTRVECQYRIYYDYTDPNIPLSDVLIGAGSKWDLSEWDDAVWGGASTSWNDEYIDGVSRNLAIYLSHTSDYYPPHIISQFFLHASPRGRRR